MTDQRRRVLVTGAARGIGRAIAERYRTDGWEVIAPTRAELDLANSAAVDAYARGLAVRGIDAIVNNAGENRIASIVDLERAVWERILAINVTAPFLLLQQLAPAMAERGWGRIVNISSVYSIVSRPGRVAYSASKAALNGLTRTAALEYGNRGVLVNAVCPGFVETDMTHQNNTPEQIAWLQSLVPLDRLATPAEIADFVHMLGSDRNSYVTGQSLAIDGGFLVQ
jgi:NAD(P)-dependent dehydrogenase (short-subunit alcohol dehydrogenase family)